MSRLDRKAHGSFRTDAEIRHIEDGIEGYTAGQGDWVDYFRLDRKHSEFDPVFGEATGNGRVYIRVKLPCIHVNHVEGGNEYGDEGFYYNDELTASILFRLFTQSGMEMADIQTGNYLRDRVVYDNKVFRVTQLSVEGQVQRPDIVIGLQSSQMKPDELVDDPTFSNWSA